MILLIHMHWHAQEATAMYSAFVVDNVSTSCFFDDHDTAPLPKNNTKPDVLFLSSISPAKSLSMYAAILVFSSSL